MRIKILATLCLVILTTLPASRVTAQVDGRMLSKLALGETPLDMSLSRDGKWLYLLTGSGNLLIYSSQGNFNGKLNVGQGFDQIMAGPTQAEIYLLSRKNKNIQVMQVSYTYNIDISNSPYKGSEDAPVTIVEYTDFQCPYCAHLGSTLDQIMQIYPGKVKIVYKSFPLNSHKYSWKAATAAVAANEKGKFWEFYKMLFAHYSQINDAKLMEIRQQFGFNTPDFESLMNSPKIRSTVATDREEGIRMGVSGTPTVFINGQQLKNKRLEGFKAAIDAALKNLDKQ